MFLGLRDIRFAKGRFALMATVIGLITMLLVLLSGLTAGLGNQSTSAIADLPSKQIIFNTPDGASPSYTESVISPDQLETWQSQLGPDVQPLGVSQARAEGDKATNVTLFGSEAAAQLAGTSTALSEGQILIDPDTAQELGLLTESDDLVANPTVSLNATEFQVAGLTSPAWYSHMPVLWMGLEDWQQLSHTPDSTVGTVLTVSPDTSATTSEIATLAETTGTTALTPKQSFSALSSYSSENGSLLMMQGFLYGISDLVIAAFLAVWTVQRTRDIAVLKALGAANRYVVFDSLVQAAVALVVGSLVGGLIGLFAGFGAQSVAPFLITVGTFAIPVLGVLVLGMAASVAAVRGATRINPLIALGGN